MRFEAGHPVRVEFTKWGGRPRIAPHDGSAERWFEILDTLTPPAPVVAD
ncbi:hypothetical protein [Nocardioides luteus]|nr:hypothetical protein [Nocardioides luteus]